VKAQAAPGSKGENAMTLQRIRIELARSHEHPEGSHRHGYEFVLPLKPNGTFDSKAWQECRELCSVHRFWAGEDDEAGHLVHTSHGHWSFAYASGDVHQEPIHRFEDHVFKKGEYISVREQDEKTYTFKVVSVQAMPIAPAQKHGNKTHQ
jgi:hypothetical protein